MFYLKYFTSTLKQYTCRWGYQSILCATEGPRGSWNVTKMADSHLHIIDDKSTSKFRTAISVYDELQIILF